MVSGIGVSKGARDKRCLVAQANYWIAVMAYCTSYGSIVGRNTLTALMMPCCSKSGLAYGHGSMYHVDWYALEDRMKVGEADRKRAKQHQTRGPAPIRTSLAELSDIVCCVWW